MNQQAGAKRILVLDNDESMRSAMRFILRRAGHEVHLAEHCDEATASYREAMIQGHRYDAVILDWDHRGERGVGVTIRQLLDLDPGVKAIVTSCKRDFHAMTYFSEHGFKGSLVKPFTSEDLEQAVHSIVNDPQRIRKSPPSTNRRPGGKHEIHTAA
jgi:DNA-binding NtrC family response regulator